MDQRKGIGWFVAFLLPALFGCGAATGDGNIGSAGSSAPDSLLADKVAETPVVAVDTLASLPFTAALVPTHVRLANGLSFDLRIPEGYSLAVAAEGLDRLRFMRLSPDGRLFVTDMHALPDNKEGKVYILDGWDERSHRFTKKRTYLKGLRNPNQVLFRIVKDTSIYVATTDKLLRYGYRSGDTVARGEPTVIDTFPAYGMNYKYGGWHLTRSLALHNDKIYVSLGSSCDACIEKEDVRAAIIQIDPDGGDRWIYASGLRNAVGLEWVMGDLFATDMGSDQFGVAGPEDKLQRVQEDHFYGWPYFYQIGDKVIMDTAFAKPDLKLRTPEAAYAALGPHTVPLGFDFLHGFNDPGLDNAFIMALHGSTSVPNANGDALVRVRHGHPVERIVDGFHQGEKRFGRPCDVLMRDANSLWFTDDQNGVLYLLYRNK